MTIRRLKDKIRRAALMVKWAVKTILNADGVHKWSIRATEKKPWREVNRVQYILLNIKPFWRALNS
jgi:hypothetical protein